MLLSIFVDLFRDNIGWCGEGGVKEWVLVDTSPLVLKNTLKFPVFRRTSPVGPGTEFSNLRIQRIPGLGQRLRQKGHIRHNQRPCE